MSYLVRFALLLAIVAGLLWWAPWREIVADAKVPPGFESHRGTHYRVAHPADWRPVTRKDGQGNDYSEINGPATEQGTYSGRVRVEERENWPYRLDVKLLQFRGAAGLGKYRIEKENPVLIEGAVRAHRFEVVQELRTPTGATARMQGTDTFALTEDQVLLHVVVRAPQGEGDKARLPEILDSFQVRPKRREIPDVGFSWPWT